MIEFLTQPSNVPLWLFLLALFVGFGGAAISLIMLFLTVTSGITLSWSQSFKRLKELFIKLKNARKKGEKK